MTSNRVNIRAILGDPEKRRAMMVEAIIALQAREGIVTTREQAEAAYAKVRLQAAESSASRPRTSSAQSKTRGTGRHRC